MAKPGFVSRFVCAKAERCYCRIMTDQCSLRIPAKMLGHGFTSVDIKTGLLYYCNWDWANWTC